MLADDIQEIEISIEDAKKAIRMGELVDRLEQNEDFKELINNIQSKYGIEVHIS